MVAAFSVKSTLRPPAKYVYEVDEPRPPLPWLTVALLLGLIAVFAIEATSAPTSDITVPPNLETLVAMGGLSLALIQQGEAYRMISAPLLHGNLLHLLMDVLLLGVAGAMLEWLAGRAWTFFIFALGALAGSGVSLLLLPADAVSIGASGAIMAMLIAWLIISAHLSDRSAKLRHQGAAFVLLALALLPLSHGAATLPKGHGVDHGFYYAAHLGGALTGGLLGLLLLLTWPYDARLPAMRPAAAILSGLAGLSFLSTAYAVTVHYPQYVDMGGLIPASQYPQNAIEQRARANDLVSQYPRDPRAHMIAGAAELQRGDRNSAEYEFRVAMTLANDQTATLFPALDNTIHAMLATTLLAEGKKADAAVMAKPACQATAASAPPPDVAAQLTKAGLCLPAPR